MKRCCFCKRLRPNPAGRATREGWKGIRVMERGQKSHWCCPLHDKNRISDHAEYVADGLERCEVA